MFAEGRQCFFLVGDDVDVLNKDVCSFENSLLTQAGQKSHKSPGRRVPLTACRPKSPRTDGTSGPSASDPGPDVRPPSTTLPVLVSAEDRLRNRWSRYVRLCY